MISICLYIAAFTLQLVSVVIIIVSSSWEVATLFKLGFRPTPAWASFFCLLFLCALSIAIPCVQILSFGCRGNFREGAIHGYHQLEISYYRSQAFILGIQSALWLVAAGYSTAVLTTIPNLFGSTNYIGIAASWSAMVFTIAMTILVIHLRKSKQKKADYLRKFRLKAESKAPAGRL